MIFMAKQVSTNLIHVVNDDTVIVMLPVKVMVSTASHLDSIIIYHIIKIPSQTQAMHLWHNDSVVQNRTMALKRRIFCV
ncbi:Chemokine-like protein [Dirofilaria immitis]